MSSVTNSLFTAVFLIAVQLAVAQPRLFSYLPDAAANQLDEQQMRYLREVQSWEGTVDIRFVEINAEALREGEIILNHKGVDYLLLQSDREENRNPLRKAWIGKVNSSQSDVHIAWKGRNVVGMVELGDESLLIRPIGKGLHIVVEWDLTIDDGCQTDENLRPDRSRNLDSQKQQPINSDQDRRNTEVQSRVVTLSNTGECNVRVLVAYTAAAKAAVPDILLDINNLINIANTGYINSSGTGGSINMSIELATAFEVAYTESGILLTDLERFTLPTDGFMDVVHNYRNLWDADQCALLVAGGGGISWQSTADADQFSVTGINNLGVFTFHHELSHNAECTHALNQADQPGTAPYAGYGEPSGCFRTVMAYQDACGTGIGTCPRQNIFSDNDANSWNCGGTDYTPGTTNNRNQDRLHLSGPLLIDHRTVLANAVYGSNYDWLAGESIHFAAADSLTYEASLGTFLFELHSGAQGSFRAAYEVHLGRGFRAHAGSSFRAWIDRGCTPFEEVAVPSRRGENPDDSKSVGSLTTYPNPAESSFEIELVVSEPQSLTVTLLDQRGQIIRQLLDGEEASGGRYTECGLVACRQLPGFGERQSWTSLAGESDCCTVMC